MQLASQDVYFGEDFVASDSLMIFDLAHNHITIKEPDANQPNVWKLVAKVADYEELGTDGRTTFYQGTVDGESVRIQATRRASAPTCCGKI